MRTIKEFYNTVYAVMQKYNSEICAVRAEMGSSLQTDTAEIDVKIAEYTEQIKNIDSILPQIEDILLLAQKYVGHRTLPTVEAPDGYRVNIKRLKMWAQLIDPLPRDPSPEEEPGDPYAQRIYMVANCDIFFLKKKRKEFTGKIAELTARKAASKADGTEAFKEKIRAVEQKMIAYLDSGEFGSFAEALKRETAAHSYSRSPESFAQRDSASEAAIGQYLLPLPAPEGYVREHIEKLLGKELYRIESSEAALPYMLSAERSYAVSIRCGSSKTRAMDKGLQNTMLDIVQHSPARMNKILFIDCARYKSTGLGLLRPLEKTCALAQVPRNSDQVTDALEELMSQVDEIDEVIDVYDTLEEYNRSVPKEKRKPKTTLILVGWPNEFMEADREMIRRLMVNHERYGITIIAVSFAAPGAKGQRDGAFPGYVEQTAIHIDAAQNALTLTDSEERAYPFRWLEAGESLDAAYVETLKKLSAEEKKLGNEYIARVGLPAVPEYLKPEFKRQYKKLELPYGISSKDELMSLSFENENFAAFLMGASRSGKSTLIHTLISGIISRYHPDNVELWLADFKQLEFKKYIDHCPPHVKYILLDESNELVYDLIDKLTEKMMERQRLFSKLGVEKLDQVDTAKLPEPLPVIFVILDEFSIMSQAVAESDIYRIRLQNLLAKGAALGIRFLFSSQTFTTGVGGLTRTAVAQIQQRIAMKGKTDEIEATLELSSALKTDKVKNWMAALPPHYSLVKCSNGPDTLPEVRRAHVLYFPEAETRDNYADALSKLMTASNTYRPDDNMHYVDKHPVTVDGNSYKTFMASEQRWHFVKYRTENADEVSANDIVLSFGVPRRMSEIEYAVVAEGSRENLLLAAPGAETGCAMSILWTTSRSFQMQGGSVSVWAYPRNRVYRSYKDSHFCRINRAEGLDEVCQEIRELKEKLRNHEQDKKLIILLGMEQICTDFGYVDGSGEAKQAESSFAQQRAALENSAAAVKTQLDEYERQFGQAWIVERGRIRDKAKADGMSREEIKKLCTEELPKFRAKYEAEHQPPTEAEAAAEIRSAPESTPAPQKEENKSGAYNALEDFAYVVKHGSAMGYHFLLLLSSVKDIKQCSLKQEFFRHKLAFRMSEDDSRDLFNSKLAARLPEHVCEYDNGFDRYSVRPYLHRDILWDGWTTDADGSAVSPLDNNKKQ